MAQEHGDLAAGQAPLHQLQGAGDDEQAGAQGGIFAAIGLHLGPVAQVQQILDGQGVQLILCGQRVDDAHVRQAIDVDPAHRDPLRTVAVEEAGQVVDLLLDHLAGAVVDAGDDHLSGGAGQRGNLVVFDPRRGGRVVLQADELWCH